VEFGNTVAEEIPEVVRPPFPLLGLSAAAALGGAALVPLMSLATHVVGYLLSSVVCFLLAALYFQKDQERAARPVDYRAWSGTRRACTAVVVLGFAVACWHMWYIASELAAR
jgi:hypothetical protein